MKKYSFWLSNPPFSAARVSSVGLLLALWLCVFSACGSDNQPAAGSTAAPFVLKVEQNLDLKSYNLPFSIKVPKDAKVNPKKGIVPEYVIEAQGYYLQIMSLNAGTDTRDMLKKAALAEVQARPEFSKLIIDEPFGFVYETKWDKLPNAYNFRYYFVVGETYYDFRSANSRALSQADATLIYQNIKQETASK